MTCPYCNSKETISIIYLYRYNDNNTFVKKNNDEVKYSERIRKPKRKNYDNYKWILKLEYYNGLSECFNGHDMIPNNWNLFIDGFRNLIKKYDKDNFLSKIKNSNIAHN